jgi:hypothetical protein
MSNIVKPSSIVIYLKVFIEYWRVYNPHNHSKSATENFPTKKAESLYTKYSFIPSVLVGLGGLGQKFKYKDYILYFRT